MSTQKQYIAAHSTIHQSKWIGTLCIDRDDERPEGVIWLEEFPEESNFRVVPRRFNTRKEALEAAEKGAKRYAR